MQESSFHAEATHRHVRQVKLIFLKCNFLFVLVLFSAGRLLSIKLGHPNTSLQLSNSKKSTPSQSLFQRMRSSAH